MGTESNTESSANEKKKILVVYYSHSGATRTLTQLIYRSLREHRITDISLEAISTKAIKNTFFGNVKAALLSLWEGEVAIDDPTYSPNEFTDIILCFPIWIGTIALPMQSYCKTHLACCTTQTKIHLCATYGGSPEYVILKALEHFGHKFHKPYKQYMTIKGADVNSSNPATSMSINRFTHHIISDTTSQYTHSS